MRWLIIDEDRKGDFSPRPDLSAYARGQRASRNVNSHRKEFSPGDYDWTREMIHEDWNVACLMSWLKHQKKWRKILRLGRTHRTHHRTPTMLSNIDHTAQLEEQMEARAAMRSFAGDASEDEELLDINDIEIDNSDLEFGDDDDAQL